MRTSKRKTQTSDKKSQTSVRKTEPRENMSQTSEKNDKLVIRSRKMSQISVGKTHASEKNYQKVKKL